jgi:hypothetical protein
MDWYLKMSGSQGIAALRVVRHGVLEVTWADGFVGQVDLQGLIGRGGVFSCLSAPAVFARAAVAKDGQSVVWAGCDGDVIDLGSQSLRVRAEVRAGFDAAA